MKKLLSVILSVITLLTVFTVPVTASAEAKKNTYIPEKIAYENSKGKVVAEGENLVYYPKNGKKKVLVKYFYDRDTTGSFYVRGNTLYYYNYCYPEYGENKKDQLYKVDLDGKNRKKIFKTNNYNYSFIGGYGSYSIWEYYNFKTDKWTFASISQQGKKKDLWSLKNIGSTYLFNGMIFNGTHKYNLDTGKVSATAVKEDVKINNKYMFYINKDGNLISLDKKGKKRLLVKKVSQIVGINEYNTVIYRKSYDLYSYNCISGKNKKVLEVNNIINKTIEQLGMSSDFKVTGCYVYYDYADIIKGKIGFSGTVNFDGTDGKKKYSKSVEVVCTADTSSKNINIINLDEESYCFRFRDVKFVDNKLHYLDCYGEEISNNSVEVE